MIRRGSVVNFSTYEMEDDLKSKGYKYIVGIDEVGRGPGAGPVVASAVYLHEEHVGKFVGTVKDSKKLSAKKRLELYEELVYCSDWGLGIIDNKTIDEVNILQATKMAMEEAFLGIDYKNCDYVLVDGNMRLEFLEYYGVDQQFVLQGDSKVVSISAASIIAKVVRDDMMKILHHEYPMYNWEKNKGYLTKEHIEAIKKYGTTKYHRLSFNKVGK
jgi:ribonuclease HII